MLLVLVPFPGFLYLYLSVPTTKQELEFSSPSRGSYISTLLTLNKTIHGFSSRPLPGVLISLHNKDSCYQALADRFSSPSRGSYISTFKKRSIAHNAFVLVPFPGFLYLYQVISYLQRTLKTFSSPSRGSYISTIHIMNREKLESMFSSPSRGSYISTKAMKLIIENNRFSSPSRGSYISTSRRNA